MRRSMIVTSVAFGLVLGGCVPALQLSPPALPEGAVGTVYSQPLSSDAEAGAIWDIAGGDLPPGVGLTATGLLAGIPTQAGTYTFTVTAVDLGNRLRQGEFTYVLVIRERLQVAGTLDAARVNQFYSDTLTATGGVAPYTFQVVGLPAGIGYEPATGVVSGTPIYPIVGDPLDVTVTDSGTPAQTATRRITFAVKDEPVSITTTSLPDAVVGSSNYSAALHAVHGAPPYHWAVVAGVLPKGLELVLDTGEIRSRRNPGTGAVEPVPADATGATFSVRVTDNDSPATTDTREFTIAVVPAP